MSDDIAAFALFIVVVLALVAARRSWGFEIAALIALAMIIAALGRMIPA